MPKDDERKEMTQEELDAREEKFRTFFTTSVAQVPEEMTRRDDENEENPFTLMQSVCLSDCSFLDSGCGECSGGAGLPENTDIEISEDFQIQHRRRKGIR